MCFSRWLISSIMKGREKKIYPLSSHHAFYKPLLCSTIAFCHREDVFHLNHFGCSSFSLIWCPFWDGTTIPVYSISNVVTSRVADWPLWEIGYWITWTTGVMKQGSGCWEQVAPDWVLVTTAESTLYCPFSFHLPELASWWSEPVCFCKRLPWSLRPCHTI